MYQDQAQTLSQDLHSQRGRSMYSSYNADFSIESTKTTFIAEGVDIEIENCYIAKSPYINSFRQKVGPYEVTKYYISI